MRTLSTAKSSRPACTRSGRRRWPGAAVCAAARRGGHRKVAPRPALPGHPHQAWSERGCRRAQGSPFHIDSPLHPVAAALRGLAPALERDPRPSAAQSAGCCTWTKPITRRERAWQPWRTCSTWRARARAALLSDVMPLQLKQLTLDGLASRRNPGCAKITTDPLVEDVHWLDPTTLELIERVIADVPNARSWSCSPLGKLSSCRVGRGGRAWPPWSWTGGSTRHAVRLFTAICGEAASPELGRDVAARTGGVPLFIEECARVLAEDGTHATSAAAVPATLNECRRPSWIVPAPPRWWHRRPRCGGTRACSPPSWPRSSRCPRRPSVRRWRGWRRQECSSDAGTIGRRSGRSVIHCCARPPTTPS